jgi:hypothetical protein
MEAVWVAATTDAVQPRHEIELNASLITQNRSDNG